MKKLMLLGFTLLCFPLFLTGQEPVSPQTTILRNNLTLRPNSRDYNIIRRGNNHQRVIQLRSQALIRNKQALLNRKMAMERRRTIIQQQMLRKQNIHQRMIHQRGRTR